MQIYMTARAYHRYSRERRIYQESNGRTHSSKHCFDCDCQENLVASTLTKCTFEPEQFPGPIYRTPEWPVCLIFASGKIAIIGAKPEEQVVDIESSLLKVLEQFRLNTSY
jgi:TATA-box binding protein (TBP) (component of TFIID and TFIIIB)